MAVKKGECQLAFSTECFALDWVAMAHIFKLEIENFSVLLKIIKIGGTNLSEKSGRHLDESANVQIYTGTQQECYLGYCLPVIEVSRKQDIIRPFIVPESKWKIDN